jgi:hypothetical protein
MRNTDKLLVGKLEWKRPGLHGRLILKCGTWQCGMNCIGSR